jgi:hypothetical protein
VDLSEFAGQPLSNAVLRPATDKIMTAVTALLGGLRGQQPPAEFYHPAVARRKLRQELRALQSLQEAQGLKDADNQPDGVASGSADPGIEPGPAAGTPAR